MKDPDELKVEVTQKCTGACGEYLPATTEYFTRISKNSERLRRTCKACRAAQDKKRDQDKKDGTYVPKRHVEKETQVVLAHATISLTEATSDPLQAPETRNGNTDSQLPTTGSQDGLEKPVVIVDGEFKEKKLPPKIKKLDAKEKIKTKARFRAIKALVENHQVEFSKLYNRELFFMGEKDQKWISFTDKTFETDEPLTESESNIA